MQQLNQLLPEIGLTVFALLVLMADPFLRGRQGRALYYIGILSAALGLALLGLSYSAPEVYQGESQLWVVDPMSLYFKVLILASALLTLFLSVEYGGPIEAHKGSYTALVLLACVGMMLLVSSTDLLMIFLSLELVSIASFILVGFERRIRRSSEGAVKYYLMGAFSSAIMVYGISLFYGATGTTQLAGVPPIFAQGPSTMFLMSCLMLLVGFGFKASMVPFHFWVPDAYEGAPTPIASFLSVAPKIAALAVMLRVFTHLIPHSALDMTTVFAALAMLTMTFGNLVAIFQNNVKRLFAYSSIAQAGYMLIGFVTGDSMGREGLLLYALAYLFMNIGAFTVAEIIGNEGEPGTEKDPYDISAFNGLAKRNLGLALLMTFFLLSLAGIPPLAGFVGKFYLFAAAIKGRFFFLALVAVLNSVVSVYYYMRIAYCMFFREPARDDAPNVGLFLFSSLAVAAVGVFLVGILPEPFMEAVKASATLLPGVGSGLP